MPRPVRICFLIGSLERCGTSVHLLGLLRRLDRTRYQPWVVGVAERGPMAQAIRNLGIEVHDFQLGTLFSMTAWKFFFWLAWRIRRSGTSIVQSYLFLENILGPLAARLGGARWVITGRRTVDEWESPRHLLAYRLTNPLVDRIAVVSPQVEASVRRWERVSPRKIVVVANAQSQETLAARTDPDEAEILQELDRKMGGGFVFGTVGNVRPIKGHDIFLRAFQKVLSRHPGIHLVLVGGMLPEAPPDLPRMVRELGMDDSVHLVGLRNDVAGFMNRFSVFVLPSRAEGMSNALLEALLLGKPVIATRFGLPRMEDGSEVVLAVEPGDEAALAEAMERVMLDRDLRDSLAARARTYAATVMDEAAMVRKYEQLYKELLP
jgi:L-malate glycosyltransferase